MQRTIHLDIAHCAFLKLLVHSPHPHASNASNQVCSCRLLTSLTAAIPPSLQRSVGLTEALGGQVVFQEIELLGTLERPRDPLLSCGVTTTLPSHLISSRSTSDAHLAATQWGDDEAELHAALIDAGVALDIVTRVTSLPAQPRSGYVDPALPSRAGQQGAATSSGQPDSPTRDIEEAAASAESSSSRTLQPRQTRSSSSRLVNISEVSSSVFDTFIREELVRRRRYDDVLNEILHRNVLVTDATLSSAALGLLPAIAATDRGNLLEIVLYTFGNLSCECVCCDVAEMRALAVTTAECFVPVLRDTMGSMVAFEGAIALLQISLRDIDPHVFQVALHFAQSLFQQSSAYESGALGLVEEVTAGRLNQTLRLVFDALLTSPRCSSMAAVHHPSAQLSRGTGKRRISPDVLRFIRLFLSQERTRPSVYRALVPEEDKAASNQTGSNRVDEIGWALHSNRLRVMRWLLQQHESGGVQVPREVVDAMQRYCSARLLLSPGETVTHTQTQTCERLATTCLLLLERVLGQTSTSNSVKRSPKPLLLPDIYSRTSESERPSGSTDTSKRTTCSSVSRSQRD